MATSEATASPIPSFLRGSSVIGLTQASEEQSDDDHRNDQQGIGHGARIAQIEEAQTGPEGEERKGLGRDPRTAARQRERDVEELERFGEAQQEDDDDRRLEEGQHDLAQHIEEG